MIPHRLIISTQAMEDMRLGYAWHYGVSPDLAVAWEGDLLDAFRRACLQPFAYAVVEQDMRRVLFKRFSYGAYFRILSDQAVRITAILHNHQHPNRWQARH